MKNASFFRKIANPSVSWQYGATRLIGKIVRRMPMAMRIIGRKISGFAPEFDVTNSGFVRLGDPVLVKGWRSGVPIGFACEPFRKTATVRSGHGFAVILGLRH
jgi:hypothetical protein